MRIPVLSMAALLCACRGAPHDGPLAADATPLPPMASSPSPDAAIVDAGRDASAPDTSAAVTRARTHFPTARITTFDGLVIVAADPAAPFDPTVALARRTWTAFFDGQHFGQRPPFAVTVLVFSSTEGLQKYTGLTKDIGVYDRNAHEIAFDASAGKLTTLSHELAHAAMQGDFDRAQRWFDECIGTVFEVPVWPPDGGIEGNPHQPPVRVEDAKRLVRSGAHFGDLFGELNIPFGEAGADGETLARSMCMWLQSRGQMWTFYRAWRDGWKDDRIGRRSFEAATGMTVEQADGAWREWVTGLK